MDNVDTEVVGNEIQSTEVEADRQQEANSIRDALNGHLSESDETQAVERSSTEITKSDSEDEIEIREEATQVIPVVPPSDMNKLEKEAFLNPTPQNAHVLQQYMNRRAYETRADYQRKIHEVEQLRAQAAPMLDTIKQYESEYARHGVSLGDIAKRSVAWDQAMKADPVATALEWLDSYGVTLDELHGYNPQQQQVYQNGYQQPQQQPGYLTRDEAERIAEEKVAALQQQQQQSAVAYYNERVVESFIANKPLFKDPETASQLETEMAPIVSALTGTGKYSSPEEILETAYNYVVSGNPTFSSLQKAMTVKPAIEQKQAAASKAKAAARSISGSAGSGTPRIQVKDIRDNLRRRMSGE